MQQEIIDYISQAQKHGLTDFEIKQNLLNAGWEASVVEESFVFAKAAESKPQTPQSTTAPLRQSTSLNLNLKPQDKQTSPANSNITITEQHFASAPSTGFKKSAVVILAVLLVLALGGVAFGYYQYVYNTPQKILEKYFLNRSANETLNTDFTLSYSDKNIPLTTEADSEKQDLTFGISGNGYYDNRDKDTQKAEATTKLFSKSGLGESSFELKTISIGKVIFFNLDKFPQIKNMLGDQSVSWLKLDIDELQKYAEENLPGTTASSTNSMITNPELRDKLIKIWENGKFMTAGSVMAKEVVDGTPVYRLEPQIDQAKITEAVLNSIDTIQSFQKLEDPKLTENDKKAIGLLIEKFKIKEFKLWIGQKDYKLYKLSFAIAAPSVSDLTKTNGGDYIPALSSARAKSRDAKRLADIRQLATALELYANDNHGGYPEAQNGTPLDLSPNYIGEMPTSPAPTDGTCTDYYNTYWYVPTGKPVVYNKKNVYPDYELTFCLGGKTGSYNAGIAKLTKNGIQASIDCPSTKENCEKLPAAESEQILEEIKKMDFAAEILYEATFKDYGVTKELVAPENSLDIIELITGALGQARSQSADAKRLADIRQLASALELYFNDNNAYPENFSKISPTYIGVVPTAPAPAGGTCSEQDNAYTYKFISKDKYELNFCLGSETGGYAAGKHTLSQEGIH